MIEYAIWVQLYWLGAAIIFVLLLARLSFFKANRRYLLLTLVGGLFVAYYPIPMNVTESLTSNITSMVFLDELTILSTEKVLGATQLNFDTSNIIYFIWVTIAILLSLKTSTGFIQLYLLRKKSVKKLQYGQTIYWTAKKHTPFSFYNAIYISTAQQLTDEDIQLIASHEATHITKKHSVDIVFIQILKILFWWSPLIYMYEIFIKRNHEYEADEIVLSNHQTIDKYTNLLLRNTIPEYQFALYNYFNQEQLKKRIIMMFNKQSSQYNLWKYFSFLPLVLGLMIIQSCQQEDNQPENYTSPIVDKSESIASTLEIADTVSVFDPDTYEETTTIIKREVEVFKVTEEMPRFPGCEDVSGALPRKNCAQKKMIEFIYSHIKYPETARGNGTEGTAFIQFVVMPSGALVNIKIVKDPGDGCGQEALNTVIKMNGMDKKWIAGRQNGVKVAVQFILPIKFKLT